MSNKKTRLLKIAIIIVGSLFAARTAWRFPWKTAFLVLLEANLTVLLIALCVNLLSLMAKGWAWHLLLKPSVPHRWKAAQKANLIGAAVNCLSVSVAGEAARIQALVKEEGVPLQAAVISVVWARVVEAIGLTLFVLLAPSLLHLPLILRKIQIGAGAVLAVFLLLMMLRQGRRRAVWRPQFLRSALSSLAEIGSYKRLFWPIILILFNWSAQWSTFHLALLATRTHPGLSASFMALLATNLGGLLRLTPANIGVFQASMVASLLSFGIPSERGMAASLALQGIQVIPVVIAGILIMAPWRSLLRRSADSYGIPESDHGAFS